MNGGLFKTTSRIALAVAASVAATSAMAADLGGNCCADLEERIAELEATTVRKGNRKVSLTLSGQVHESILFWDDGHERNTYVGVNNINSSSRFRMLGQAKIDAEWSAGYLIEIETQGKSDSNDVNQLSSNLGGTGLNTRHNAWWIDNKRLGRIWLGLTDAATAGLEGINLANTAYVANNKVGLLQSSFRLRLNDGTLTALTWGNILGGNSGYVGLGNETRNNVIKYVSPTVAGFIFSAAFGEDDFWDVSLKYANEFNGVRVAAGIGYAQATDANPNNGGPGGPHFNGCTDAFGFNATDRDCSSFVVAGSMMHVPTGLFISSSYGKRRDDLRDELFADLGVGGKKDDTYLTITGGVERNFIGIGKTTFYGEYENYNGTPVSGGTLNAAGAPGFFIVESDVDVWGLGVVQAIDAAAMDLYIGFRNYSADLKVSDSPTNVRAGGRGIEDFQVINVGGVIRF